MGTPSYFDDDCIAAGTHLRRLGDTLARMDVMGIAGTHAGTDRLGLHAVQAPMVQALARGSERVAWAARCHVLVCASRSAEQPDEFGKALAQLLHG